MAHTVDVLVHVSIPPQPDDPPLDTYILIRVTGCIEAHENLSVVTGQIQHLAVANDYRGRGIAGCLLELCLGALEQQGIIKSHVHVLHSNLIGNEFWIRRGWIHRAEIEMYSFVNGDNPNV